MDKTLVVFEGPAGSGKTTLIKNQFDGKGFKYLQLRDKLNIDRPRSYDGTEGIRLAQIKDQVTTSDFIFEPHPACITDRWYLSQFVYGSIRKKMEATPRDIIRLGMRDVLYQSQSAALRGAEPFLHQEHQAIKFVIRLVVFLPSPRVLKFLRESAPVGREYPFDVQQEIDLYYEAYEEIEGHGSKRPALFGMGDETSHVRIIAAKYVYDDISYLQTTYLYQMISGLVGVHDAVPD